MERCEYDLHVLCHLIDVLASNRSLHDLADVCLIHLIAENLNKAFSQSLIIVHCLYVLEDIYLCYFGRYNVCMLRSELRAVCPVCLVSVVFLRIVASCDVDACDRTGLSDCKRKLRCRTHIVEDVGFYAVSSKYGCCLFSEQS